MEGKKTILEVPQLTQRGGTSRGVQLCCCARVDMFPCHADGRMFRSRSLMVEPQWVQVYNRSECGSPDRSDTRAGND